MPVIPSVRQKTMSLASTASQSRLLGQFLVSKNKEDVRFLKNDHKVSICKNTYVQGYPLSHNSTYKHTHTPIYTLYFANGTLNIRK